MAVLLDRHSRFAVPAETHILAHGAALDAAGLEGHEALLRSWRSQPRCAEFPVDEAELRRRFLAGPSTGRALLLAILEAQAQRRHKPRWAEKTPNNLVYWRRLFQWFPEAKLVIMQRDGRDVLRSMPSLGPEGQDSPWRYGSTWRRSVQLAREVQQARPSQVCQVRYEDLLAQPDVELRRVMAFLDEPFEGAQLSRATPTEVVLERELAL